MAFFLYLLQLSNNPMTIFDNLFLSVQKHYKPTYKQKANSYALWYVSLLQSGLLLLSGILIAVFLKGMHTSGMNSENAWLLYVLVVLFLCLKNWLQYSGKKSKIMRANTKKFNPINYSMRTLWLVLIGIFSLCILLLQAF